MFWFVFLSPGEPGYLLPRETPPSRTGAAGDAGVPAPARAAGGAGGAAGPSPSRPAEVALLSAAAARQGRGSAA